MYNRTFMSMKSVSYRISYRIRQANDFSRALTDESYNHTIIRYNERWNKFVLIVSIEVHRKSEFQNVEGVGGIDQFPKENSIPLPWVFHSDYLTLWICGFLGVCSFGWYYFIAEIDFFLEFRSCECSDFEIWISLINPTEQRIFKT